MAVCVLGGFVVFYMYLYMEDWDMRDTTLTFSVPHGMAEAVRARAGEMGLTVSSLVWHVMRCYLIGIPERELWRAADVSKEAYEAWRTGDSPLLELLDWKEKGK